MKLRAVQWLGEGCESSHTEGEGKVVLGTTFVSPWFPRGTEPTGETGSGHGLSAIPPEFSPKSSTGRPSGETQRCMLLGPALSQ